jgi:hypothetical protein
MRQRILQHRPSARAGVLLMLRPHIRSRHTDRNVSPVQTGRQCCTERTITLNRLPFLPRRHLPRMSLSLSTFVEELPGVGASDRQATNIVGQNWDARPAR